MNLSALFIHRPVGTTLMTVALAGSLIGLFVSLISDVIYTWIDPRIDFERRDV